METKDLIGKRFNNLIVIEFAYKKNNRAYMENVKFEYKQSMTL